MAEQPHPQAPPHPQTPVQAAASVPASSSASVDPQTIAVKYVGEDTWLYGAQVVTPGDTVDLPADEVAAWGAQPPDAFQKES